MKKFLILLIVIAASFTVKAQTATLTAKGDSLCWSFTAPEEIECVFIEVQNNKTGGRYKMTFCVQPGANFNCMASNVSSASGCCDAGRLKGEFRLTIRRKDGTFFFSNTVTL